MEIDYGLIGERVRKARKNKKWSQEKLSEEIDVSTAFMSRIEQGRGKVNLKRLALLSEALEIPIEELITGTVVDSKNYLDRDLYDILIQCTPTKQRLIYNIAKIVLNSKFV